MSSAIVPAFAHPERVVSTEWVDEHLGDPDVRLIEVDVDTDAYGERHIPGAVGWSWRTDLCDPLRRDILDGSSFTGLMARSGARRDQKLVFYGDSNNWFAAWGLWQAWLLGHTDVALMDGGRRRWLAEGRAVTDAPTMVETTRYHRGQPRSNNRALLEDVRIASSEGTADLIDVRSPPEFDGTILAPPGLPETCQRGGHIPGAVNLPWSKTLRPDGTFKSRSELNTIFDSLRLSPNRSIVTYCRIGERSAHTWFVLRFLLGHEHVSNYDGSWTEWGNLVGAPIER